LDLNYRVGRPEPLRESGRVVSERGFINLGDKDTEESGGLLTGVRLELRVDLNNECGGYGRE
jgi:hypothetical protein